MNAIDIIILIPILWGFWRGYTKGAIMAAATLAAFFLGVWGGIHLSDGLAALIIKWTGSESPYIPLISFALVFVGILFAVYGVAKMVDRVFEKSALGIINKLLGGVVGCFKYVFIISVLFFVIDSLEKKIEIIPAKMKDSSLLYRPVSSIAPTIIPGLKNTDLAKLMDHADTVEVHVKLPLKKDSLGK
ncbi:MAG TPA: CvpA family protein [Bacteroidia bacterium]|jgi:membrane protein required for colicin V production|nr:CvpA family protein [Bacteroidia bacterium]